MAKTSAMLEHQEFQLLHVASVYTIAMQTGFQEHVHYNVLQLHFTQIRGVSQCQKRTQTSTYSSAAQLCKTGCEMSKEKCCFSCVYPKPLPFSSVLSQYGSLGNGRATQSLRVKFKIDLSIKPRYGFTGFGRCYN